MNSAILPRGLNMLKQRVKTVVFSILELKRVWIIAVVACWLALTGGSVRGQSDPPPPPPQSFDMNDASRSYALGAYDNVSTVTLGLTVRIPIATLAGRHGLGIEVALLYSPSIAAEMLTSDGEAIPGIRLPIMRRFEAGLFPTPGPWVLAYFPKDGPPASYDCPPPPDTCFPYDTYGGLFPPVLATMDGTVHAFGSIHRDDVWNLGDDARHNRRRTWDGSYMEWRISERTVYMKDGTQIYLDNYHRDRRVSRMQDTNGNYVELLEEPRSDGYVWGSRFQAIVTDTLGRQIRIEKESDSRYAVHVPGYQGADRVFIFETTENVDYLKLPNNTQYEFRYQNVRVSTPLYLPYVLKFLSEIKFPQGGTVGYAYPSESWLDPQLISRTISDGRGNSGTTRFQMTGGEPDSFGRRYWTPRAPITTTITRADGSYEEHYITGTSQFYGPPLTQWRKTYDADGSLLRETRNEYEWERSGSDGDPRVERLINGPGHNHRIKRQWIIEGNARRKIEYDYDRDGYANTVWISPTERIIVNHTRGNVVEARYYDYEHRGGGLLKRVTASYLKPGDYDPEYGLDRRHILNRLVREEVYGPGGELLQRTINDYDQYEGTDPHGNQRQLIPPPEVTGHAAEYSADFYFRGNVTTTSQWISDDRNAITTFRYDTTGNIRDAFDPNGKRTQTAFNADYLYAFPTQITNAVEHTLQNTYDFNTGLITRTVGPNGSADAYNYTYDDPFNRVKMATPPIGAASTTTYDDTPNAVSVTTSTGPHLRRTKYDGLGRPWRVEEKLDDGAPVVTATEYNSMGQVSSVTNPGRGNPSTSQTVFSYDGLGRNTQVRRQDGSILRATYTENIRTAEDEVGNTTVHTYDGLERLVEIQDGSQSDGTRRITQYEHDALGNVTRVVQGNQTREFFYDGLSRLVAYIIPEVGVIDGVSLRYERIGRRVSALLRYDLAGNLIEERTAVGPYDTPQLGVISYSYDDLGRLTGISYPDVLYGDRTIRTPAVSFGYDTTERFGIGRFAWQQNGDNVRTEVAEYDALGRPRFVKQTLFGLTGQTEYRYDDLGNLSFMKYPSGREVTFQNALLRLSGVTTPDGAVVSGLQYSPEGRLTHATYRNGLELDRIYNERQQPETIRVGKQEDPPKISLQYSFQLAPARNNGSLRTLTDLAENSTLTLGYNKRDELTGATKSGGSNPWQQEFGIDPYGNATITTIGGESRSPVLSFDPLTNRISTGGFRYCASGELYADPLSNQKYFYDGAGRLVEVQDLQGTIKEKYWYDGSGHRIAKQEGEISERMFYYVDFYSGMVLSEYFGRPSQDEVPAASGPQQWTYLHSDHLASVRAATDERGELVQQTDYLPFGEEIGRSESRPITRKFAGKERDENTKMDYSQARYYAYLQGRFSAVDPLMASALPSRPGSWNRYSYALNNPYKYTDPTGLRICSRNNSDAGCYSYEGDQDWLDNEERKEREIQEYCRYNPSKCQDGKIKGPDTTVEAIVIPSLNEAEQLYLAKSVAQVMEDSRPQFRAAYRRWTYQTKFNAWRFAEGVLDAVVNTFSPLNPLRANTLLAENLEHQKVFKHGGPRRGAKYAALKTSAAIVRVSKKVVPALKVLEAYELGHGIHEAWENAHEVYFAPEKPLPKSYIGPAR